MMLRREWIMPAAVCLVLAGVIIGELLIMGLALINQAPDTVPTPITITGLPG